ncbi:NADP-dependent isocitrate dehydrogenase [Roseovarius atlanticus]|uniref:NADP-dependent isocitrate dehydrogenase n=1 Tax=Roseovarius atlanticus TaxID=1641875 RepID=UPI001C94D517|nr:NADP-dependent isocitrate dehydrogenase [Roseovarius atlanticus]MBY5990196.1 NADP-dependent isocitrate dehydrogenase [Roseovarius atlanticus]MBY6126742.1 NADP-dependent isocitrate dehydrogenase [Roseovarius atlanticus]MBY6151235.1 NADP-dependent isocitrate dehydrogenase [Roseovarius atlanticus]
MADTSTPDIIYTKVDEAPELASASLLPIIQSFATAADITVGTRDISLAGRILATFPDHLTEDQRVSDDLAALGELVKQPGANVIKLPNISASVPQLVAAVRELQGQGYAIPDYPETPETDAEKEVRARYDAIKGSAVNPVLREGNSDRRAAAPVKKYAQNNPHRMGDWSSDSKTRVASMESGDFFSNETSATLDGAATAKIVLEGANGETVLKDGVSYPAGTVVDATYMSAAALDAFLADEIKKTKDEGVLFSIHLKATMMKVSDPIIFGHAVKEWLKPVFEKYGDRMKELGVNPASGMGDLLERVKDDAEIMAAIEDCRAARPPMYMVDSDRGITNLHVPSDVIIDASMPALIRSGGKGWGPDNKEHDAVCVIPDSSYAPVYDESIKFFKENGKLDPATAGTVQNLGLMAQKAEEYGSHPTTFEIPEDGTVKMILEDGTVLHSHEVKKGDIWRSASARKAPIEDWVNLAIERQKATGYRAIFWLDETRAHDAELISFVKPILESKGVADKFEIMAPREATRASLETITKGENTIAITGNVLRDYLTDLFPILELATSAKMLSIVKLMNGGGLFETGAGGSAPKHVQQLQSENHLRWDSLGEFCALGESFKFLGETKDNARARILGETIEEATQGILDHNRSPSRKVGEPDNRDSHYWFARYWAEALAAQSDDPKLAEEFAPMAKALAENEDQIVSELAAAQGSPADTGGYYHPDEGRLAAVMRPSPTLNGIIGK